MVSRSTRPIVGLISILLITVASAAAPHPGTPQANSQPLQRLEGQKGLHIGTREDLGRAAPDQPVVSGRIILRRSEEADRLFELRIAQQHNPRSPYYRKWLTPSQVGDEFGPDDASFQRLIAWVKASGLVVTDLPASRSSIGFSGYVADAERAFSVPVHAVRGRRTGIMELAADPELPVALARSVRAVSLSSPVLAERDSSELGERRATTGPVISPQLNWPYQGGFQFVAPQDFLTIYNVSPVWSSGIDGSGQTIAVATGSNVRADDFLWFRQSFGLPATTLQSVHPGCANPGLVLANIFEASVDAEWAGVAAPGATLQVASCPDTPGGEQGPLTALRNLIESPTPPSIISFSYATCESSLNSAQRQDIDNMFRLAAVEGVSVFVASGDRGAGQTACDTVVDYWLTEGIQVNAFATSPYVVAVGGTDFSDKYDGSTKQYWDTVTPPSADNFYRSALSYIPEMAWNESCASSLVYSFYGNGFSSPAAFCNSGFNVGIAYGGSGGKSQYVAKPSWQLGVTGVPNDGARGVPDVSLVSSGYSWWQHGMIACATDPATVNTACDLSQSAQIGFGTSFAAPAFAGVQALINQKLASRQGNPNYALYQIARLEYNGGGAGFGSLSTCNSSLGSASSVACVFHDVTKGDTTMPCFYTTPDCAGPQAGSYGVISSTLPGAVKTYAATAGWDFATGLGSVNVTSLVNAVATVDNYVRQTYTQGDLNGDGFGDIVLTPAAGNEVTRLLMSGNEILHSIREGTSPGLGSPVLGDINGDGRADYVWKDAAGVVSVWLSTGEAASSKSSVGSAPSNTVLTGVADFNGDGFGDIVYEDLSTGTVTVWLMTGSAHQAVTRNLAAGERVAAIGDLDGDGLADIATVTSGGMVRAYLSLPDNSSRLVTIGTLPSLSAPLGAADLNADGTTDLLFFNAQASQLVSWSLNSDAGIASTTAFALPAGTSVASVVDINGSRRANVLAQDANGGLSLYWLTSANVWTGPLAVAGAVGGSVPTGWSVVPAQPRPIH